NEANDLLRKALLRRSQNNPDLFYNQLLSWLFVQQKQYDRAFTQEKAIFRRTLEGLIEMMDLAYIAMDNNDYPIAREILDYIVENTTSETSKLQAYQSLMEIEVRTATKASYPDIQNKFENLIGMYDSDGRTFELQLDYNKFQAFNNNKKN